MKIEASSGPDIAIFKRFRDFWQNIDQTNFDTASDEVAITSFKERVISELLVCFALFDERVGLEERGERWCGTWTQFLELRHPQHKRYVINVETWKENDHYQEALRIVLGLKEVNDCVEHGVKLIQEYNSILTNDDQQKHSQYLLQLVQQHRHVLSDSKKTTVVSGLTGQPKLM
ncbi:hypothetical protein Bpfe_018515 [Biomphalaria pfeifferi]|uniref:Uncharacterized protein n=1 Tax=Biomphalaria pfeifferi TaxID=112525 RepID=A0AAD8BDJ5_BIOPF|nr:hypothetical protein Bpfe_018515 [Biomphalaria pfeifferi]